MNIAYVCCGILAVLYFALAFNVSVARVRSQRGYGNDADSTAWLTKAVRAHGNAAEYIPILMLLIIIAESSNKPDWADYLYFATIAVRVSHAAGMLLSPDINKAHPLRFIGVLGTYLCGLALAGMAFWAAM